MHQAAHPVDRPGSAGALAACFGAGLLIVACTLPVLFLATPPLIDVLGHTGRFALQTGLEAHPWWQQFYSFHWQVIGNLGADLLVQLVHPVLGLQASVRLAVILVPLIAGSAILLLSHAFHRRVTPFAVMALTLIYGLPFTWGFLNFSLAMALALLAFWLWLRLSQTGRPRMRTLAFLCISLAIWTCHTFGWAFLGILCTAECLVRAKVTERLMPALLRTGWDCLPLLAPLAPMLAWRGTASQTDTNGWFDFAQKAEWIVKVLRLDWQLADMLSAAILLLAVVAGGLVRRIRVAPVPAAAAALAALAFVLLPGQIFGSVYADMRLTPYVFVLGLLMLRDDGSPGLHKALMAGAVVFLTLRLALTMHVYREREMLIERQLAALQAIPEHSRVAMLVGMPCPKDWALPWYSHLGSLALTRKEILVNDQWANASMNPLTVHYPQAGPFATDDRQLFQPARCRRLATLSQALQALPTRAFTHVWVVGAAPERIPQHIALIRVWRGDDAAVFRVEHR